MGNLSIRTINYTLKYKTVMHHRFARFFLVQNAKMGKNNKLPQTIPNVHNIYITKDTKIDQVSIRYTIIFHCKTLQKLPQFGFLV
jgi:hypothetical protein